MTVYIWRVLPVRRPVVILEYQNRQNTDHTMLYSDTLILAIIYNSGTELGFNGKLFSGLYRWY